MELIEVHRRSFKAQAVRVTRGNMAEVAEWCGGTLIRTLLDDPHLVQVSVGHGRNLREINAIVGNWVVLSHNQFSVHRNAVFLGTFDLREQNDLKTRQEEVTKILRKAFQHNGLLERQHDYPLEKIEAHREETIASIVKIFGGQA